MPITEREIDEELEGVILSIVRDKNVRPSILIDRVRDEIDRSREQISSGMRDLLSQNKIMLNSDRELEYSG